MPVKYRGSLDGVRAFIKDLGIIENKQIMLPVMEGNLCRDEIVNVCINGGIRYAMIEQDDCNGLDPFDCLELSLKNLKSANV
ncbi:hypothetical protein EOM86_13895 [Candidatus Nomurabacteria bacterium]|jgi:hypothetical protein|nr:hypothetical protein [Candidatus Nomurabacteria bacterium]